MSRYKLNDIAVTIDEVEEMARRYNLDHLDLDEFAKRAGYTINGDTEVIADTEVSDAELRYNQKVKEAGGSVYETKTSTFSNQFTNPTIETTQTKSNYVEFDKSNDPNLNPRLKAKFDDIEDQFNAPDLFKSYTEGTYTAAGPGAPGVANLRTIHPYKDGSDGSYVNLESSKKELIGIKEKGYPLGDFEFSGDIPSQELIEQYTRNKLKEQAKNKATVYEINEAVEKMSKEERIAAGLEVTERLNILGFGVTEKNGVIDTDDLYEQLRNQQDSHDINRKNFINSDLVKSHQEFIKNIEDKNYKFDIKAGEDVVTVKNGKIIPSRLFREWKRNFQIIKSKEKEILKSTLDGIFKRKEANDLTQEYDLLRRDYNQANKALSGFLVTGSGLVMGGMEYAEAGWNLIKSLDDNVGFKIDGKMVNATAPSTFFKEKGQELRTKNEELMDKYRPDVEFGDAFKDGNFMQFAIEELYRQAPIYMMIAASGGSASALGIGEIGSVIAGASVLGIQTGGQQIGDMTRQERLANTNEFSYDDVDVTSDEKKFWIGTGFGLAEGIFGTAPTLFIMRKAGRALLKGWGRDVFTKQTLTYLKQQAPGLASTMALESISEGTTSIVQNAIIGRPLMEGVDHAAFSGGMFSGILGGSPIISGMIAQKFADNATFLKFRKNVVQIQKMNDEAKKGVDNIAALEKLQKENDQILYDIDNQMRSKLDKAAYEGYRDVTVEQEILRAEAEKLMKPDRRRNKESTLNRLEELKIDFDALQVQRDMFRNVDNYANKYSVLETSDKARYDEIRRLAKQKIMSEKGANDTPNNDTIEKEAYDIFIEQEIEADIAKQKKNLKSIGAKPIKKVFETEKEAQQWFKQQKNKDGKLLFSETQLENSKNANGWNMKDTGEIFLVKENMRKNERTRTASHEVGHKVFWEILGMNSDSKEFNQAAKAITMWLKSTHGTVYNEMFSGIVSEGRVEFDKKGFIPAEVIMGFIERVGTGQIDLTKESNRSMAGMFNLLINNAMGKAVGEAGKINFESENDVVKFIGDIATKISKGELTRADITRAKEKVVLSEAKQEDGSGPAFSKSDLFTKSERAFNDALAKYYPGKKWDDLTKEQKLIVGMEVGEVWGPYASTLLRARELVPGYNTFKSSILDVLTTSVETGHNGIPWLVSTWDGTSRKLSSHIIDNISNRLQHVIELPQFAEFGVQTESMNQDDYYRQIPAGEGGAFESTLDQSERLTGEYRKILKINKNQELYNTVLEKVTTTLSKNRKILDNPKKFRKSLQAEFEKTLQKEIGKIIGTQKSTKFKEFISDKANVQKLVDILGVKYRNRFPVFTTFGGTMDTGTSDVNQASTEGSFVKSRTAGNDIWTPRKVDKAMMKEVYDTFVSGRETAHKSLKKAFANELALDAVHQALESSVDLKQQYEGVIGSITEAIKREPSISFSSKQENVSNAIYAFEAYKNEGEKSQAFLDAMQDFPAIVKEKILNQLSITNLQAPAYKTFLNTIKEYSPEYAKLKNTKIITKENGEKIVNQDAVNDMIDFALKLAKVLDPRVAEIFGLDFLGFHERVINTSEKGGNTLKVEQIKKLAEKDANGEVNTVLESGEKVYKDKFVHLLDDIDNIMLMDESAVKDRNMRTLLDPIYKESNLEKKQEMLSEIEDKIIKSNKANGDLMTYLILKMNEAGGTKSQLFMIGQAQSNIVSGFRALSVLEHIQLVEGIQIGNKSKPSKNISKGKRKPIKVYNADIKKYRESWEQVVGFTEIFSKTKNKTSKVTKKKMTLEERYKETIGLLRVKNEHLGASVITMSHIIGKLGNKEIKTEQDARDLIKDHVTLYAAKGQLDGMDKEGSKVSLENKSRMLKFIPKSEQSQYYHISGENSIKHIEKELIKEVLADEVMVFSRDNKAKKMAFSGGPQKGMSIFDFDDTLVNSKSKVKYKIPRRLPDGRFNWKVVGFGSMSDSGSLTPAEFAKQHEALVDAGAEFDFSEFNKVIDGKKGPLFKLAEKRKEKFGNKDIYILTARPQQSANAIHSFLKGVGLEIPIKNIVGLENGTPESKANWVISKVSEGYNDIYFVDDAWKNVKAVQDVLNQTNVKSDVQQVRVDFSTINKTFSKIIEQNTGVKAQAKFSDVVARRKGAGKGKYKWFLPPSAEDFKGLLYYFIGKGKKGDADMLWFKNTIIEPYSKAIQAMNLAKQSVKVNYQKLLKTHLDVKKILSKTIPSGDFTYDQAVRIYIWSKNNIEIPGLSKRDKNKIIKQVSSNTDLVKFANTLEVLGSNNDGYSKPDQYWDVGSILSDLDNVSHKVGRKEFLAGWIKNKNEIFSNENLNKIQAIYGNNFREALEDSLYRMENGTNRPAGSNRLVNTWLNWVNNSVGAIMFFNRKSALLQTLSTVNFLNWSDNNPLKAAMAFANQPQFWSDFAMIFNSSKLKERRRGLQTDVNTAEIANQAAGAKNKPQAILSYLLKIGFTPTQMVDSFAIAFGGASMYRNRLNTYLNNGLSQKDAEAKAWEDFSNTSEETQQSADPMYISQQQASTMGRLVLAFQNTPMQYTRLMKKAALDLANRRGDPKAHISKIIYYGAVQNFIFSALQNAMFTMLPGLNGDEDEDVERQMVKDERKWISTINSMADTILRGSGLTGAVISTIKNVLMEYEKQDKKGFIADHTYTIIQALNVSPPIGSKARKMYSAIQAKKFDGDAMAERGFSATTNGKLNLSPMYGVVGNIASGAFNIPLDRVVDETNAIVEAFDSRNEDWQRIALALGWKTWHVGAKNEEHDLIKAAGAERRKKEGIEKGKKTRAENKRKEQERISNLSFEERRKEIIIKKYGIEKYNELYGN